MSVDPQIANLKYIAGEVVRLIPFLLGGDVNKPATKITVETINKLCESISISPAIKTELLRFVGWGPKSTTFQSETIICGTNSTGEDCFQCDESSRLRFIERFNVYQRIVDTNGNGISLQLFDAEIHKDLSPQFTLSQLVNTFITTPPNQIMLPIVQLNPDLLKSVNEAKDGILKVTLGTVTLHELLIKSVQEGSREGCFAIVKIIRIIKNSAIVPVQITSDVIHIYAEITVFDKSSGVINFSFGGGYNEGIKIPGVQSHSGNFVIYTADDVGRATFLNSSKLTRDDVSRHEIVDMFLLEKHHLECLQRDFLDKVTEISKIDDNVYYLSVKDTRYVAAAGVLLTPQLFGFYNCAILIASVFLDRISIPLGNPLLARHKDTYEPSLKYLKFLALYKSGYPFDVLSQFAFSGRVEVLAEIDHYRRFIESQDKVANVSFDTLTLFEPDNDPFFQYPKQYDRVGPPMYDKGIVNPLRLQLDRSSSLDVGLYTLSELLEKETGKKRGPGSEDAYVDADVDEDEGRTQKRQRRGGSKNKKKSKKINKKKPRKTRRKKNRTYKSTKSY